jgi:arylsulfatase A-like enzyme
LDPIFGVARGFGHYDHASGNDHQMRRADRMVDRALAWADAHRTQPFFLVVHFFDPHMNYDPPPAVRGRFTSTVLPSRFALPVHNTDAIRKYAGQLTTNDRAFIAAAYDEEIAFVDREIGRLLATLKDQHLERLLIVLTADHGEELFDHGGFGHGHAMYDELLRVPLMVWGPGVRPARIATPVSVIDIAPTVLNAAGIEPPAPMAGISLWPILTSTPIAGEPTPAEDRVLVAERTGQHPERKVVIQWPYKAVSDPDGGPPQLFDLSADPGETVDRANAEKAVGTRLARHLEAAFAAPPDDAGGQAAAMDEGVREQLRGLGYVE